MVKAKRHVQTAGDEDIHENMEFEASKGTNAENLIEGQDDNQKVGYEKGQTSGQGETNVSQMMQQMMEVMVNPQTKLTVKFMGTLKKVMENINESSQKKNEEIDQISQQPPFTHVGNYSTYESRKGKEVIDLEQNAISSGNRVEGNKQMMHHAPMFQNIPTPRYQPPWKVNTNVSNYIPVSRKNTNVGDEEILENIEFEASKGKNTDKLNKSLDNNQQTGYEKGQSSSQGKAIANPQTKGANNFINMLKKNEDIGQHFEVSFDPGGSVVTKIKTNQSTK